MASEQRNVIEEIVSKIDITEVVSQYVKLEKKGKNHFGLCPFHNDTSPSMSVSPEKRMYKCFVCGAGGNVISFVSDIEKIPFSNAMQKLAEKVGVDFKVTKIEAKYNHSQQSLVAIFKDAKDFYSYSLTSNSTPESKAAFNYVSGRGLTSAIINEFGIGYAPNDGLANLLVAKGHAPAMMLNSSLVNQISNDKYTDRNRNRVIFSITNDYGDVVGFSARALDDSKPKYINTSENEIFKKSEILYNYSNAQNYIDKENKVYICEGFMDVIALSRIGVKNAVAIMGTSFTSVNAEKLRGRKITLLLDFDQAGIDATKRAIEILKDYTQSLSVVVPLNDDSKDCDETLMHGGPEALKKLIANEVEVAQYMFDLLFVKSEPKGPTAQINAIKDFNRHIGKTDAFTTEYWCQKIAMQINMSFESVASVMSGKGIIKSEVVSKYAFSPNKIKKDNVKKEIENDAKSDQDENYLFELELINSMLSEPDEIVPHFTSPKYRKFANSFTQNVFEATIEIYNDEQLKELFDGYNAENDKRKLWKKIYNNLIANKVEKLPDENELYEKLSNMKNFLKTDPSHNDIEKRIAMFKRKSLTRLLDDMIVKNEKRNSQDITERISELKNEINKLNELIVKLSK